MVASASQSSASAATRCLSAARSRFAASLRYLVPAFAHFRLPHRIRMVPCPCRMAMGRGATPLTSRVEGSFHVRTGYSYSYCIFSAISVMCGRIELIGVIYSSFYLPKSQFLRGDELDVPSWWGIHIQSTEQHPVLITNTTYC